MNILIINLTPEQVQMFVDLAGLVTVKVEPELITMELSPDEYQPA